MQVKKCQRGEKIMVDFPKVKKISCDKVNWIFRACDSLEARTKHQCAWEKKRSLIIAFMISAICHAAALYLISTVDRSANAIMMCVLYRVHNFIATCMHICIRGFYNPHWAYTLCDAASINLSLKSLFAKYRYQSSDGERHRHNR